MPEALLPTPGVRTSVPEASPPPGVVRTTGPEAPSFHPAAVPPAAVDVSPAAAGSGAAPGLPEDAVRSPSAIGYTALAEQVAAQASATTRLQEQLQAVLADGRRQEAEARRREVQLAENAARQQAENSAALKALSDSTIALGAAQQQSVNQFSDLRSSLER